MSWKIGWIDVKEYFTEQDVLARQRMNSNRVYPFTQVRPNVFVLMLPKPRIYVFFMVVNVICIVILLILIELSQIRPELGFLIAILIVVLIYHSCIVYTRYKTCILVYDREKATYEVFNGEDLIYQGHSHNLYFQMLSEGLGYEQRKYKLVVDGYKHHKFTVIRLIDRPNTVRHIGNQMASNLGLNFFDIDRVSTQHFVRQEYPQVQEPEF